MKQLKKTIEKSDAKKGRKIIDLNFKAVDATLANLYEVEYPKTVSAAIHELLIVAKTAPQFVQEVTRVMMVGYGGKLSGSQMPIDGTYPNGTTLWEKKKCIGYCAFLGVIYLYSMR